MPHLACGRCGRHLTGTVAEVSLPPPVAEEPPGAGRFLPPRMPRGTYATGLAPGGFVLHPGDVAGTARHPSPARLNGCCGLDGLDGPNLVCAGCRGEVAVLQSDRWSQQVIMPFELVRLVASAT